MDPSLPKKVKSSHDYIDNLSFIRMNNCATYTMSKEANDPKNIPANIIKAMGSRTQNKEFENCRVIVESTIFSLHSFVLLSRSEYFRCKYRTMTDKSSDMTVRLSKMAASTFQRILDILYTGENLLTLENLKEMWHAVHQLEIAVLIRLCEDFVVAQLSLDNLAMYVKHEDYSHSRRVHIGIQQLVIKNFSTLRTTDVFLDLDLEDLKQVVKSDDLFVESEDFVLEAIFRWVVSNENERMKYLADLLQCTRYCLASKSCIETLRKHSFIQNDARVDEILAMAFAFDSDICGFWPTSAIYRDSSGYEHVGVYCTTKSKFIHVSLKRNKVINLTGIPAHNALKLAVANGRLVICSNYVGKIELSAQAKNMWLHARYFKIKARDKCRFMISHESNIFVFSKTNMYRFYPNDWNAEVQESIFDIASPRHVMSFYNKILAFSSVDDPLVEKTAVYAWSSMTNTWSHLENLSFTANGMVSFKDDRSTYIVDQCGHFWTLTNADPIVFTYIGQLWDVKLVLTGALLFMNSLYLFVVSLPTMEELNLKSDLGSGVFEDVKFHCTEANISNIVHVPMERDSSTLMLK